MAGNPGYLVFISHSKKDRWIARQISDLIIAKCRRHRVSTFLDEKDIEGGQSIPVSVRRHLQNCDELLILLSAYSVSRPWVLVELGAAWGMEKRIVSLIDKLTTEEMPDVVREYRAFDLNELDAYLVELSGRAKSKRP